MAQAGGADTGFCEGLRAVDALVFQELNQQCDVARGDFLAFAHDFSLQAKASDTDKNESVDGR